MDYLETNLEMLEAEEENDKEERQEKVETPTITLIVTALDDLSLRDETKKLYKQSVCLVCFKRKRTFAILPYSHFTVCDFCEGKTRKCPRIDCQEVIECTIRTYF